MKRFLVIIATFVSALPAFCSDNFDTKLIPDSLLKNANVVKRLEQTTFEVFSSKEVVMRYRYVVTVLNEKGDRDAVFQEWYDKFRKIDNIEGSLYDANGKLIKKLKKLDIKDYAAADGISLMQDNRVKVFSFQHKIYPYTVEYQAEVKQTHTLYLPSWNAIDHENQSVEQSSFLLIIPESLPFKYRSFNLRSEPNVLVQKGKKMISWEARNLVAIERDFAMPDFRELTPRATFAAENFEIDGYKGSMASWNELGKFMYELKKDRDALPEDLRQKALQLVAGVTDEKEKVRRIFEFLQKNTRYISIQLGIGGFQPFDASYVAQKGYGDCKALSNYMYSLLKAVGIDSKYVIIQAGSNFYMTEDFPSNQFNHATLCVPMKNDTMWLECTSQTVPAGYQGSFTGNRKALLVDETGGYLVSTKSYGVNENQQLRKITGTVSEDGNMEIAVRTNFMAIKGEFRHQMINALSKEKILELLNNRLDLPSYTVNSFDHTEHKTDLPSIVENLNITVRNYASVSGKRLFITPNLMNKNNFKSSTKERTLDIVLKDAYRDVDTVEIDVPAGYEVEALPEPVSLKTKYGSYNSSVKFHNNKIVYIRALEQYTGRYPAKEYAAFAAYYDAIYKADRAKVVLVKK
jgi:transglutaminase-like putative cysteine protease